MGELRSPKGVMGELRSPKGVMGELRSPTQVGLDQTKTESRWTLPLLSSSLLRQVSTLVYSSHLCLAVFVVLRVSGTWMLRATCVLVTNLSGCVRNTVLTLTLSYPSRCVSLVLSKLSVSASRSLLGMSSITVL
jgi:hypothetical protein